jgi:sigma-B regulation protein RsbU (phosphoserine phosphatase)
MNKSQNDFPQPEDQKYSMERLLIEASYIINSDLELDSLLKNVLKILTNYLNAEASAILLLDKNSDRSEYFVFSADQDLVNKPISLKNDKGIIAMVTEKKKPMIIKKFTPGGHLKSIVDQKLGISSRNLIATPIKHKDEFLGVIEVVNKKDTENFDENDLEIMKALGEQIAMAIDNANLILHARRKTREAQNLYVVGKLMAGTLELEELLELIVKRVSRLVRVDVATIYIVDPEDHSIKEIVSKGVPKHIQSKLTLKIGQGICGWVAKTGKSIILNDVTENKQYISIRPQVRSEIAVPLKSQGRVIGVFNVEADEKNAYTKDDLRLMKTFANHAAVSIERALLYRQTIEQKALEDELAIARRIQKTFLPKKNPQMPGFDIAGVNIPSEAVGGDYYDFIKIVENQLGIAIGDVSGKGMGAALIMASFRASLKAEIRNNFAIRTIFAKVNSLLYESIERENYVTAVYGVLDIKNHVLTFSNAGHNPPLLFKSEGNIVELVEGGMALGMFADSLYEERPLYIENGDILLFYTDGVTEAINTESEEFGLNRLKKLVEDHRDSSAKNIINNVINAVFKFKDTGKPLDDLTMILIKCL